MTQFFTTPHGRKLAYDFIEGAGPAVVVLHGFRSDMEGSKAVALAQWAKSQGRPLLRFDFSGHGQSSGTFEAGSIGEWAQDAADIIDGLCPDRVILVGSSMGGWISLLLARMMQESIAGMVTIAAAPDFTKEPAFSTPAKEDQASMQSLGYFLMPNPYGDPYHITQKLIDDGARQSIFDRPCHLEMPARFLQGTEDSSVSVEKAQRLLSHCSGDDVRLTVVKGADHSFSTPECLALIYRSIDEVTP